MDFNAKNFRYATMTFGDFAKQVKNGKRLYLRSLSADAPTDQPASLEHDFPELGTDFAFPHELRICEEHMHSSILRVSGPVNMWLHFGEDYPRRDDLRPMLCFALDRGAQMKQRSRWLVPTLSGIVADFGLQTYKPMCTVKSTDPSACFYFHRPT